jgi:hypothetical protein
MGVIGVARRLNDRLMSGATDGRTSAGAATCNAFVMWAVVAGLMSVDANNEKGTPDDDATSGCCVNPDRGRLDVAGRADASNFRTAIAAADAAADAARPVGAPARERNAMLVNPALVNPVLVNGPALGPTAGSGAAVNGERPDGTAVGSELIAAAVVDTVARDACVLWNRRRASGRIAAFRWVAVKGVAAMRDAVGTMEAASVVRGCPCDASRLAVAT